MNLLDIRQRLDNQWKAKSVKMDWLGLEQLLVDILNAEATDEWRVALSKEAIDAYTKRGHFKHI